LVPNGKPVNDISKNFETYSKGLLDVRYFCAPLFGTLAQIPLDPKKILSVLHSPYVPKKPMRFYASACISYMILTKTEIPA